MEVPPRASAFARVPRELDDLVDAMLAKDPARRPSLAAIATVLDRIADPQTRETTPMAEERESYHSIAVTERRVATVPRRFPRWAIPLVVLGGAGMAYAIVTVAAGDPTPQVDRVPLRVESRTVTPIEVVDAMVVVDAGAALEVAADAAVVEVDAAIARPRQRPAPAATPPLRGAPTSTPSALPPDAGEAPRPIAPPDADDTSWGDELAAVTRLDQRGRQAEVSEAIVYAVSAAAVAAGISLYVLGHKPRDLVVAPSPIAGGAALTAAWQF